MMENPVIRDVTIKLVTKRGDCKTLAYADFRYGMLDMCGTQIVEGHSGQIGIQFPRKYRTLPCHACDFPVGIVHDYCHWCGAKLARPVAELTTSGAPKLTHQIYHTWSDADRAIIQRIILNAWLEVIGVRPRGQEERHENHVA